MAKPPKHLYRAEGSLLTLNMQLVMYLFLFGAAFVACVCAGRPSDTGERGGGGSAKETAAVVHHERRRGGGGGGGGGGDDDE